MTRSYLSQLNDQLAHPKPCVKRERAAKQRARSERRTRFHFDVLYQSRGKCENVACMSLLKRVTDRLHCHHILYSSDCGPDTAENGIALCPTCHRNAHEGVTHKGERISGRHWVWITLNLIKAAHPERFRWDAAYAGLSQILDNKSIGTDAATQQGCRDDHPHP